MSLVLPQSPEPSYSLVEEQEFLTLVTTFQTGTEHRQGLVRFPTRTVKLEYTSLTTAEIDILWNFFKGRRGQLYTFLWFHPDVQAYEDEYTGQGDAGTTVFDLPGSGIDEQSLTVYVNGSITTPDFLSGGGDGGADRIEFAEAPAAGALITADFSGHLRLICRFKEQKMNREWFEAGLRRTTLDLQEVR